MPRFDKLKAKLRKCLHDDRGQTMPEYTVVMMISSATVFLLPGFGSSVANAMTSVARLLP